ncbi:GNAT family N-acetyltransferase [Pseudomonas sp. EpS/L25]|uniref:GNAT family N-acetyltransferase n=1 Tax=Pseudomonas sp. EpS/L25 TaxID=1749078 RepID=UPI0007435916|nr:GNAT family N-acetyltransferase [Pseudomonas sp. EpS/L25]KUM43961.1 acetyltransferase [Pseudomonas sp. EpS/L25]
MTVPTTLLLPSGQELHGHWSEAVLTLSLNGRQLATATGVDDLWQVRELAAEQESSLWCLAYWLLVRSVADQLEWQGLSPDLANRSGLVLRRTDGALVTERTAFWQLPTPWLRQPATTPWPQTWAWSGAIRHLRRPPKPEGEVYRRFDTRLGSWISLRTLDLTVDLPSFHRWQNSPRVAAFWQEEGSLEQHRAYLQRLAEDPHVQTLIGCFDDEPFAYFEAYWAKEDRIGPYYGVGDHDRGLHMLVGEEGHRGAHKVACWLPAVAHWLFLDEPRTQRLVCEPRADNERMIAHLQRQGFYRQKDFDFPHKRAALMLLERERFFDRCVLA